MENYLTFSTPITAADAGRRIIAGQIVPFGEIGYTNIGKVIFERGSITIPNPTKVKLLAAHSNENPVGRAQSFNETEKGIDAVFKLSASSKGTDAIMLASEGLVDGLSIGAEITASRERKDGTIVVTAAILKEVSLVESPAFGEFAKVAQVVAQAAPMEDEGVEIEDALETAEDVEIQKISDAVDTLRTLQDLERVAESTETESESEATVSEQTTAATTEAAAAPAAEASRPVIKASQPYITQTVRHGITSMGRYTEHKIKAARGDEESKLWIAAAEDPQVVQAAADSIGTTNPAFNPIQYLTNEFISNTNFGTPTIDAISRGTLPNSGMSISIPKLTTAPTVAVTPEGDTPSDTGMVSAYLTGTVSKYAGIQTITTELLDRSDPVFFDELSIQLQRAYLKSIDTAVIAGLVAGGTAGTKNYTADSAGIIDFVSTEAPLAYTGTSYFAKNFVGSGGIWSLLMSATDTTGRPIYNAVNPWNAGGDAKPTSIMGNVLGLDLYVDRLMASGVVDNSAFIIAPEAATWYASPTSYMSVNVVSNLEVQTAIYGYGSLIVKQAAGIRKFNIA